MAKKTKKAPAKKAPAKRKLSKKNTADVIDTTPVTKTVDDSAEHPLEVGMTSAEKKYLEKRIDICVKAYPQFTRGEAKWWLLDNNSKTKIVERV